jgi:sirohydrochlorin cobaltochelatase
MEAVAAHIARSQPNTSVACTYLELCEPGLLDAAAQMIAELQNTTNFIAPNADSMPAANPKSLKIRILPMFLGMGKHAREDLPELVAQLKVKHPNVRFEVSAAVGEDERVIALLAQLALS